MFDHMGNFGSTTPTRRSMALSDQYIGTPRDKFSLHAAASHGRGPKNLSKVDTWEGFFDSYKGKMGGQDGRR